MEPQGIAIPSTVECQLAEFLYPVNMDLDELSKICPRWMMLDTFTSLD